MLRRRERKNSWVDANNLLRELINRMKAFVRQQSSYEFVHVVRDGAIGNHHTFDFVLLTFDTFLLIVISGFF